jgi:L-ascorbate metabolism protein UlaG (beta-lactamase superfamily)
MAEVALETALSWISWFGQSAIRIAYPSAQGQAAKIIWIDPHKIARREKSDLLLVTHPHSDHFDQESMDLLYGPSTIGIGPTEVILRRPGMLTLEPGQTKDIHWVKVEAVPAYNLVKSSNHPKASKWNGYILSLGGCRIWHAGDTERIPEIKTFKADIAMVPLGQTYTMGSVEEAAGAVIDSGARIAIPIHYGMYEGSAADAASFESILKGKVRVVRLEQQKK